MPECAIAAPYAVEAGAEVCRLGGNAVDAAVATAFALSVAYPHNTSLGGDVIALVRQPSGAIQVVNASGYASRHVDAARLRGRYGGSMPANGIETVTVPGAVAGLGALHAAGGILPWAACIQPAINLAESSPAAGNLAAAVAGNLDLVLADGGCTALLAPTGRPLAAGDPLRQPALARTLQRLATDGAVDLYTGAVAADLAAGLADLGSPIDADDLAAFCPEVVPPLTQPFRQWDLWTAPPNSQGLLVLEILGILDAAGIADPLGRDAAVLAQVFRLASNDRRMALADPPAMKLSVPELLDPDRLSALAATAVQRASDGRPSDAGPVAPPGGDTVAITTSDTDGRAVCLIQSVFHLLGSGIVEPRTGLMLHNRGAAFSLQPQSPNCLAPRKRPAHTLMPVIVTTGSRLAWVVGTMGGTRQPQIQAQLLLHLAAGSAPEEALAAPRFVVEGADDQPMAFVETADVDAAAVIGASLPITWQGPDDEMTGRAQIAWVGPQGARSATDPRGEGGAISVKPALHP
jgi:gamma-glutamyltranspeptidase